MVDWVDDVVLKRNVCGKDFVVMVNVVGCSNGMMGIIIGLF